MLLRAANRRRPITDRPPRPGGAQPRVRVVGLQLGRAAPPVHRLVRCRRGRRQQAERLGTAFRQAPALVVDRPLEPRRLPQKEAVEKRARVDPYGPLVGARVERVLKIPHIGRDHCPIETERLLAEEQLVAVEVASLEIDQLVQPVTRPLDIALGPEIGLDLVAVQPPVTRDGEQREQGQPTTLGCRPRRRVTTHQNVQAAERQETKLLHQKRCEYPRNTSAFAKSPPPPGLPLCHSSVFRSRLARTRTGTLSVNVSPPRATATPGSTKMT